MKKGVSIIVLNYNGVEHLKKCLPSIFDSNQGEIPFEVLVVDNGSSDESLKYVRKNYPQAKIIEMGYNAGYCKANNAAAEAAIFPLLFFLNNDTTVAENFLAPLVRHFNDPYVFAVGPKVLRPYEDMLDEAIIVGYFKGGCINVDNKISRNISPLPSEPLAIFNTCGAAMLVDKKKFLQLNGFDTIFHPFYLEETDLCYRAWKMNWKVIYEPKSTIYHFHNKTIGEKFRRFKILTSFRKNQYLFIWKNITDRWMILSNILQMLLPKLLIPNHIEWAAIFWALKQLPEAIAKRRWNKKALLSDKEAFAKTSYLIKYYK